MEQAEPPNRLEITNADEIARAVNRGTVARWTILIAIVALGFVLPWASARVEANRADNADTSQVERERAARSTAQPQSGEGWEVTQQWCAFTDDAASYSGRITNTGTEAADYTIDVRFVDSDGVLIGTGGTVVPELEPGKAANWSIFTPLQRFVDGAPLAECLMGIEVNPFDIPPLELPSLEPYEVPTLEELMGLTTTTTAPAG